MRRKAASKSDGAGITAAEAIAAAMLPPLVDKPEHIMQFFTYNHLPEYLQDVSEPFCNLAVTITSVVPRNPERTVALRKLLEAKDAAVRAMVAKKDDS